MEWVAIPFSGGSSQTRIEPKSPELQADPLPSEPPGKPKNTGVGSLSLLQGIFPSRESNQGLLHCKRILYQLSCQGSHILTNILWPPACYMYTTERCGFLPTSPDPAPPPPVEAPSCTSCITGWKLISPWLDRGVFCELNNVDTVLNSLFHAAHFHAIQSDLTKDSSPLQCKGHPLYIPVNSAAACRPGEQPAAVMDATRACDPQCMPVPPAPNFRDLPFAGRLLLRHRLAWGQFCRGQGLLGGGSADTHASAHSPC